VIRLQAARVETLVDRLGDLLAAPTPDPFADDLVITRSGGIQRWLAQQLACRLGASGRGDGVCAAVEFSTIAQFAAKARGRPSAWSAQTLLPLVMDLLSDLPGDDVFAQLRTHLGDPATRPRRRIELGRRIAGRFSHHATWNLDLMARWSAGEVVGPDGSELEDPLRWQPYFWNLLCDRAGLTPWEESQATSDAAPDHAQQYARVVLFCPDLVTPADEALLAAIDSVRPVQLLQLADSPGPVVAPVAARLTGPATSAAQALGRLCNDQQTLPADEPPRTFLAAVQQSLSGGQTQAVACDDSIRVHPTPADRQVEALSELLVSLLNDDPTLEPRDILVLTHQQFTGTNELAAYFRPDDAPEAHPRHQIRVATTPDGPAPDDMMELLYLVLAIVQGRATAQDLLQLCRSPGVAAHFGFGESDAERLAMLITGSGMRWGVNAETRRSFGMGMFAHNTWMAGLGRLVLGVALREDDLVYHGTVFPFDTVDSDAVRLVEALGEIIAHVRTCCQTWPEPAPAPVWARRFTDTLEALTGSAWLASGAHWAVNACAAQGGTQLSPTEITTLLDDIWQGYVRPVSFLNGSLGVARLGSMSLVPHRVIVLAGLDTATFPQPRRIDGDDVTWAEPQPQADPRERDRQHFYDALMSARDKLVVMYAEVDPATRAHVPAPTPVTDLIEVCSACAGDAGIDGLVRRWDPAAATRPGAAAVTSRLEPLPAPALEQADIDDVCELLVNPAAYWLKRNAGLVASVLKPPEPVPAQIPVELSALDVWGMTNRMVRLLLSGQPGDAIVQAELRRGTTPPGEAGAVIVNNALGQALDITRRANRFPAGPLSWRAIALTSQNAPELTGQIGVRGQMLVEVQAGSVRPRHQIAAWCRLLALAVAYPDEKWSAVLVGLRRTVTLDAPPPPQARHHLDYIRRIHLKGFEEPLPMPASASAHLGQSIATGMPPDEKRLNERFQSEWEQDPSWGLIWPSGEAMRQMYESRFQALADGVYAPMMRAGGVA